MHILSLTKTTHNHPEKQILFMTNNSRSSRKVFKVKFDKLGITAFPHEIYSSAYAAAVYISSVLKFPKEHKVYVIGDAGVEEELTEEGITFLGGMVSQNKH